MPALSDDDYELIRRAARLVEAHGDDRLHTVAAAARDSNGRIVAGLNVFHFTGGPCAELVVLGMAAAEGMTELETLVVVGDRGRGVVPPCGRCRQVLLDHQPSIDVIVPNHDGPEKLPIAQLLPVACVWTPEAGSRPPAAK